MLARRLLWFLVLTFSVAWLVPGILLAFAVVVDGFSIDASLYSPVHYLCTSNRVHTHIRSASFEIESDLP